MDIDVAIIKENEILMGRKPNELFFRFIGGFVDPSDESEEQTCRREVYEETGCAIDGLKFITSMKIDDWRYRKEESKIMTHFYIGHYQTGKVSPNDDISELKWIKISEFKNFTVMKEHEILKNALIDFLKI